MPMPGRRSLASVLPLVLALVLLLALNGVLAQGWDEDGQALGIDVDAAAPEVDAGALGPALAWPEVCQPLFDRREGSDYPWAQRCKSYSFGGQDHQDALLCGLAEGRWNHALLCELFRVATDCLEGPRVCAPGGTAIAETLRAGLRRGKAPLPKDAGDMVEVLLVGAAPALVESAPDGKISFATFASMYAVAELCLRAQPKFMQRIYHLRPEALNREGCRDVVVEHFEHVFESLAGAGTVPPKLPRTAPRTGSAAAEQRISSAVRKHIIGLLPQGPLGVADAEPAGTGHYLHLPKDEVWTRFVVRAPRVGADDEPGIARWLGLQKAWGWQNAWAALRLAGKLDELLADEHTAAEHLDAWLEALGAERQGMLDGREVVDGEQRQVGYRRWRVTHRTLTPISGQYRPMWRAALLRRAAEPDVAALFELPGGEANASRGWRCGAVLTWAELPVSCSEALAESGTDVATERGDLDGTSLARAPGGGCHVILNRAVLRSPADAAALGLGDCDVWFGAPTVMHNASYAVRPQWLHAEFNALEVLQRYLLPKALHNISAAARAVHDANSSEPLASRLLHFAESVAEFTYYMFNGALYTRGSAAITILSHHAMFLWLLRHEDDASDRAAAARHRLQALRCLPNWRPHTMPDIEASTCHTAGAYVRGAYWASFEVPPEAARASLAECLGRQLQPSEEAADRGRSDAQRMREALRELRAVPA